VGGSYQGWGVENFNSVGITNNMGDGLAYKFTKLSSNTWRIDPWDSGAMVSQWCFMLCTAPTCSGGVQIGAEQTFQQSVTMAEMQAFYKQTYNGHIYKPWYTEDGINFTRVTESWYDTTNNIFYFTFTPQSAYCKVAPFFPWNYKHNQWNASTFVGNQYADVYNIATSPGGRDVKFLELTNFSVPESDKRHIGIIWGTHPEPVSTLLVQGLCKHIVQTPHLRDNFHWYICPCMAVDGVYGAGWPSFYTWNSTTNPIVNAIRTKFDAVNAAYGMDATWDCHSQGTGSSNHLLYCNEALAFCQTIVARVPRFVYYSYNTPAASGLTGYAYTNYHAKDGGKSLGFVTEPTQCRWLDTVDSLNAEGAQIAEAHYDYFF
jgi:hypothetical protein